jgi:hypothetical protein
MLEIILIYTYVVGAGLTYMHLELCAEVDGQTLDPVKASISIAFWPIMVPSTVAVGLWEVFTRDK